MPLNPQDTYVYLGKDGAATEVPGGAQFWSLPDTDMEHYGKGWVISEFMFSESWSNWEMHPNADEFVYLLSGAVEVLLEHPEGLKTVRIEGSGAVVVPRGIWHTARVIAPSRMLHVTQGAGTQHRSV
jgi:uncharacterized cupin superfamily protein